MRQALGVPGCAARRLHIPDLHVPRVLPSARGRSGFTSRSRGPGYYAAAGGRTLQPDRCSSGLVRQRCRLSRAVRLRPTVGSSSAATLGPSGYGKPCVTGVVSSATTAAVPRMPPATGGATMSSVGSLIDVRTSVEKESVQDGRGNTVDDTGNGREATGNSTGEPGNTPDDAGNAPR